MNLLVSKALDGQVSRETLSKVYEKTKGDLLGKELFIKV
jgi:hypothetical protein